MSYTKSDAGMNGTLVEYVIKPANLLYMSQMYSWWNSPIRLALHYQGGFPGDDILNTNRSKTLHETVVNEASYVLWNTLGFKKYGLSTNAGLTSFENTISFGMCCMSVISHSDGYIYISTPFQPMVSLKS